MAKNAVVAEEPKANLRHRVETAEKTLKAMQDAFAVYIKAGNEAQAAVNKRLTTLEKEIG